MFYNHRAIDWQSWHGNYSEEDFGTGQVPGCHVAGHYWHEWLHSQRSAFQDTFARGDLETLSNSTCVVLKTNLGLTHLLFGNPRYRDQLLGMGLRPDTAFGCAIAFLFHPSAKVMRTVVPAYEQLLHSSQWIHSSALSPAVVGPQTQVVIGLQIRTGDAAFKRGGEAVKSRLGEHWSGGMVEAFTACAESLQAELEAMGVKVMWMVISDSQAVRHNLMHRSNVVSAPELPLGHTLDKRVTNTVRDKWSVMFSAVGEQWLFSKICSYFVISRYSGYGRVAAAMSLRPGAIYNINNRVVQNRSCSLATYDSWDTVARMEPFL